MSRDVGRPKITAEFIQRDLEVYLADPDVKVEYLEESEDDD